MGPYLKSKRDLGGVPIAGPSVFILLPPISKQYEAEHYIIKFSAFSG